MNNNIKVAPYKGINDLLFKNNYKQVFNKLGNYTLIEDFSEVIEKRFPRILVEELGLMINFNTNKQSIRFFEFLKIHDNLFYKNINLFDNSYDKLEKKIREYDSEININSEGFQSNKLGISILRKLKDGIYNQEIDSVLIFSKEYNNEPEIDLNELYKSIMGDDFEI
jgi:hypothetical protein